MTPDNRVTVGMIASFVSVGVFFTGTFSESLRIMWIGIVLMSFSAGLVLWKRDPR